MEDHHARLRTRHSRARLSPLDRKWLPRRTGSGPLARGAKVNLGRAAWGSGRCDGSAGEAKEGEGPPKKTGGLRRRLSLQVHNRPQGSSFEAADLTGETPKLLR